MFALGDVGAICEILSALFKLGWQDVIRSAKDSNKMSHAVNANDCSVFSDGDSGMEI